MSIDIVRVEIDTVNYKEGIQRRAGVYRLDAAEATVEKTFSRGAWLARVKVNASTRESALALWDRIMEGSIAPALDYEAAQVPTPTFDPDRLAKLEAQATNLAMMLLEQAMAKLQSRIVPS